MLKKVWVFMGIAIWTFIFLVAEVPVSDDTRTCLDCHTSIHPGIVETWRSSGHARNTPAAAQRVEGLAAKFSGKNIPESLKQVSVGCAECHTLRAEDHRDTFDHNGHRIHVVVSPADCAVCHADEYRQFSQNLMSHAHGNLVENRVYQMLIRVINQDTRFQDNRVDGLPANSLTEAESCLYCHGTRLEFGGLTVRETVLGEMSFPVIKGWPNQGVGRVNLDGSLGSCSACHTRHRFSLEMARKPFTCRECHVGPDVPAYKVYASSKHGNIFSAQNGSWDFDAIPWTVGKDFTAPTCAACHISLLVNTEGEVVSQRTHRMNDRLPWRIFGLIYAHPHPLQPDTSQIKNRDGLPLPTDFNGNFAGDYLIGREVGRERRVRLQKICLSCHGASWVENQWKRFENTINTTNTQVKTATLIMKAVWSRHHARGLDRNANPFDEAIERKWMAIWLIYANTIRFASAMGCGGDYGVFADGRYQLTETLSQLEEWLGLKTGSGIEN